MKNLPQAFVDSNNTLLPRAYWLLALISLILFLPGQMSLPAIDRDEARFAQASKQMLESGDYVDIRFQDEARHKKPIGIYWLQAAAVKITNAPLDAIWAYRLPSLLGAILAVLFTTFLTARLFGGMLGLMAGLMLAGCAVLGIEARLAKTDAALLACIVAAQIPLALAYVRHNINWPWRVLFALALGVGILIKGPIIILVVGGTILALWWADRKLTDKNLSWLKALKPWHCLALVALVVAPWLIAISIKSGGAFWQESVGHDLLGKVTQGQNWGGAPPGLHLLLFNAVFWPFALLTFLAAPAIWQARQEPAVRFLLAWIIPTWLVFEISFSKLAHYTMPCLPAIAALTAYGLSRNWRDFWQKHWVSKSLLFLIFFIVSLGLWVAIISAPVLLTAQFNFMLVGMALVALIALALALSHLSRREYRSAVFMLLLSSTLTIPTALGQVLPQLQPLWLAAQVQQAIKADTPCPNWQAVTAGFNEPSIVFALGTRTEFLNDGSKAAAAMLNNRCLVPVVSAAQSAAFMAVAGEQATLITHISGFNYGSGDALELYVYRARN